MSPESYLWKKKEKKKNPPARTFFQLAVEGKQTIFYFWPDIAVVCNPVINISCLFPFLCIRCALLYASPYAQNACIHPHPHPNTQANNNKRLSDVI